MAHLLGRCVDCPRRTERPAVACWRCIEARAVDPVNECTVCGGEASLGFSECWSCSHLVPEPAFARNRTVVFKSDDVYAALLAYKYSRREGAGALLARLFEGYCALNEDDLAAYDYVVPMPWHRAEHSGAQFDHVRELVATVEGAGLAVRFETAIVLVRKSRATSARAGANRQSRLDGYREIYEALAVPEEAPDIVGARVLVVDDIFTTGTTLSAVASCLRAQGALEVSGLSLLRVR